MATKLEEARTLLLAKYPFFAPVLLRISFIPRHTVDTLSIDRYMRMYYNEGYLVHAEVELLATSLLQIVEQILRSHGARRLDRDPYIWSLACLIESADSALGLGHPLGAESLKPAWFEFPTELSAEEYYARLIRLERIELPFTAFDKDGNPVETSVPCVFRSPAQMPIIPGSDITGERQNWEDPAPPAWASTALDPLLFAGMEGEVESLTRSNKHGRVPDWLLRRHRIGRPQLAWRRQLVKLLGSTQRWGSGSTSFTYSRPSLVQDCVEDGLVLPSFESRSPTLVAIVDTSASMKADDLARATGEIDGVLRAMGMSEGLIVIPTDSTPKHVQKISAAKELKLVGGGGTDMGVGLNAASKLRPRPEAALVITDGITPWPKTPPPGMDVIIINVSLTWDAEHRANYPAPPWGKLVVMFPASTKGKKK